MSLRCQLQLAYRLRLIAQRCSAGYKLQTSTLSSRPGQETNSQYFPTVVSTRNYAKGANRPKHSAKDAKPKVSLSDEELSEVVRIQQFRSEMQKVLQRLQDSFVKHLSLHSVAGNIDKIRVHVDSQEYSLAEVAQISKKSAQLIVLNMASFPDVTGTLIHDAKLSRPCALLDVGRSDNRPGTFRVTREHRETLSKNAKALFVKAKEDLVAIERKYLKEIQKNKLGISEDVVYNASLQVKMEAENTVEQADTMTKAKQKELLGEK
ncbi:ribosome recycling factor, putative [Ixodes scapularis]|uniref:Ribosome-recycling factor, mitochondrial n=1 Tax=Ixodes scapularis TaxID=6945 RepID=B7PUS2_IXOSC|nr:ribosome recycling factor, putative [Ixodes scapularis]|eukprot:XP_002406692.1 ribosome recycling factor, putative [Ixodes scapularis]